MTSTRRYMVWWLALAAALAWLIWFGLQPPRGASFSSATAAATSAQVAQRSHARPGALVGQVKTTEGTAVVGAQVCAASAALHTLGGVDSHCALTDAAGSYALRDLDAGVYDVAVTARGYMPAATSRSRAALVRPEQDTRGVDFVLRFGGAQLAGLVLDATGGPIAAAHLDIAFGEHEKQSTGVETDQDGRFSTWLTPGHVSLTVKADGYAGSLVGHVAPSKDLVVRLAPGSSIRGRVVSGVDTGPVQNVEVRALCGHCMSSLARPRALSAADGSFEIVGLAAGSYTLLAEGDGYRGQAHETVSLGLAQTASDVILSVLPTRAVSGHVSLRDGSPCTRGLVSMGPPSHSASTGSQVPNLTTSIDELGRVSFRSVPKGTYALDVYCVDNVLTHGPTSLVVQDENVRDLDWKVAPGLALSVRVVDEASQPLANMPFIFATPAQATAAIFQTGADGQSNIGRHLTAGKYQIEAYSGYEADPVAVELRDAMSPVEVTLRLKGSSSVEVQVVTGDGSPVDSVRVTLLPRAPDAGAARVAAGPGRTFREAIPRGEGRFALDALSAGSYELHVDDGLNAPVVRKLDVGSGRVRERVMLERGETLRGRVVDAAGQPLADVWVSARCSESHDNTRAARDDGDPALRMLRESKRSASDDQGMFELTGLSRAANTCQLRADEPGGSVGLYEGAKPGDTVVISMQALGSVAGTVQLPTGGHLGSTSLLITNERYNQQRVAELTDGASSFRVPGVMPGPLKLLARNSTGGRSELSVELAPGQRLENVRLELVAAQPAPKPDAL